MEQEVKEVLGLGAIGALLTQLLANKEIVGAVFIIFLCCVCILFMCAFDLFAGVRKAKRRGELSSSYGYKRTVSKLVKYYSAVFAIIVVDALQIFVCWHLNTFTKYNLPLIPIFTIVVSLGVCFIEFKSIIEPEDAKDKAKMQEAMKLAKALAENGLDVKTIGKTLITETADSYLKGKEVKNE